MRTECRSAIGGSGLAAKAFAPASCFPSSLQRVTFSQVEKLVRRSGAPGTGVRYSTRTKSKLQFIQLVRAHRVMTPVPGERKSSKVDAEVQLEVRRALGGVIRTGVEVIKASLEAPTGRHLYRKTFSRIVVYSAGRAIFRVVQDCVACAAIVCRTTSISTADQVGCKE